MLDPYTRLKEAVILDKLSIVKLLLRRYPDLLHEADYKNNGWSLLHYASYYGNYLICVFLIQMGCDSNNNIRKDFEGNSAIHLSIIKGDEQTCHLLLQHFPATIEFTDSNGNTPLLLACKHGHHKILSLLLSCSANIRARNLDDDSALHMALKHGNLDCCKILLKSGLDSDIMNKAGYKPSDVAFTFDIEKRYLDYVQELEVDNADVYTVDTHLGNDGMKLTNDSSNYKYKATLPDIYTTITHKNGSTITDNNKYTDPSTIQKTSGFKKKPTELIYNSTSMESAGPNTNKDNNYNALKINTNNVRSFDDLEEEDGTVATPLLSGNRSNVFFNFNVNQSKNSLVRESSHDSLDKISEKSMESRISENFSSSISVDSKQDSILNKDKDELKSSTNYKRQSILATVPISKVRYTD